MNIAADINVIVPELTLAVGCMALLLLGAFQGDRLARVVGLLAVALLLFVAALVAAQPEGTLTAFGGSFLVDGFTRFAKILVLAGSALAIVMSGRFLEQEKIARFEFPLLVVLATLGMLMMVSANDLMSLYVGLELQSLSLYVLAAYHRDSERSTEAGLKYFVLGALSSGLLLYGMSLVYGSAGTIAFADLAGIATAGGANVGFQIGLIFVLAGLAFKISAVPFHMWTPDVYEGAPTPVTAFFAAAPKVAAMALILRVLFDAFSASIAEWRQVITFISIASMLLGAFAAIGQTNIKRLMAYSSIANMGFVLVGLAAGTAEGVTGVLVYLVIYVAMTVGVFVCILAMRRPDGAVEDISELSGIAKTEPLLAFAFTVLLFSYAGIPFFAGFFGKFYVFSAAVQAGLWPLAIIGVVASVIGAFYYVRIVMIMITGEPAAPFERPLGIELRVVLIASTVFTVFFVVLPGPLVQAAEAAAAVLLR